MAAGQLFPGTLFPYLFITIACGAVFWISFVGKFRNDAKNVDARISNQFIAVGAMLAEGVVSVLALIAAASLTARLFYHQRTGR